MNPGELLRVRAEEADAILGEPAREPVTVPWIPVVLLAGRRVGVLRGARVVAWVVGVRLERLCAHVVRRARVMRRLIRGHV